VVGVQVAAIGKVIHLNTHVGASSHRSQGRKVAASTVCLCRGASRNRRSRYTTSSRLPRQWSPGPHRCLVFNEAALVDLGDQGIRLCVIMPLADFGFFRSTGTDAAHPWRIRPNAFVPGEVRKSFRGSSKPALPTTEGESKHHARGHMHSGCGLQSGFCLDGPKERRNPGTRRRIFSADIFGAAITPVGAKAAALQGVAT
jgi:hypothetical protein